MALKRKKIKEGNERGNKGGRLGRKFTAGKSRVSLA